MYNWSVDIKKMRKDNPDAYKIWRLEQLINYGLGKDKINRRELKKYWGKLKLDPSKKAFFEILLKK